MANIVHSVLAGTEVHEPKGVAGASLGQVYVADGNGSGSWNNIGTSSFTGMIADFAWPVVQEGWLECDGSDINITTYSALYSAMTIQMNGTRTSGNATITSLSSTSNMRVGYYVFGVGISTGTTIISIDSGSQITLSTNATSSGIANVVVSPWLLNNGIIRLPDLSSAGRFRRSRSSSTSVGQLQDTTNLSHTHSIDANTNSQSVNHTHTFAGNTGGISQSHVHSYTQPLRTGRLYAVGQSYAVFDDFTTGVTSSQNADHVHYISGTTGSNSTNHLHRFVATSEASGSSEARPNSIVLMTCVKT